MVQSTPTPAPISLEATDALVISFLESRKDASEKSSSQISACRSIARFIGEGDIETALTKLKDGFSSILDDGRLGFRLQKARFLELLHQSGPDTDLKSIALARDELAPLAEDAYPEAYSEFRQLLLLLVYGTNHEASPLEVCGSRGSAALPLDLKKSRAELAELTYQTMRQKLGLHEPLLVLALCYLLRLRQAHYLPPPPPAQHRNTPPERSPAAQHIALPHPDSPASPESNIAAPGPADSDSISKLADALLLPQRDAAPLPAEFSEAGPGSYREADLQALIQCLGISRREAVDALKLANTEVDIALKDELARLHLDKNLLLELLVEYAAFRGLPQDILEAPASWDSSVGGSARGKPSSYDGKAAPAAMSVAESMDVDVDMEGKRPMDSREAHKPTPPEGASAADSERGASPSTSYHHNGGGGASSSSIRANMFQTHPSRSDSRSPPSKECDAVGIEKHALELQPGIFDEFPRLHFDLICCQYINLVAAGDTLGALAVVRGRLGPLTQKHEELQVPLKEAMAALVPSSAPACWSPPVLADVAASLQTMLQTRLGLGLGLPRLVLLLEHLLGIHHHWVCSESFSDPFMTLLSLRQLSPVGSHPVAAGSAAGAGRASDSVHGMLRLQLGSEPSDWVSLAVDEEGEEGVDEELVLRIMEVAEVSRSTAISMLQQHEGDFDAAINGYFQDLYS
eukprot:gene20920-27768_t